MITVGEYVKPRSIDEAYSLLTSRTDATLLGGGAFVRLAPRKIGLAIDLSDAGLDYIKDMGGSIEIGAMTTLREIEKSKLLKDNFGEFFTNSVKNIVGTQLRNIVTIGATVYSKYGFSDPITALRSLDVRVVLRGGGVITLDEFIDGPSRGRDILEKLIIRKNSPHASFQMLRNSLGDYSILNASASKSDSGIKIVVGARPGVAKYAEKAMEFINVNGLTAENAVKAGEIAAEELEFTDNYLASGQYRKDICGALVKRAIMEVFEQ